MCVLFPLKYYSFSYLYALIFVLIPRQNSWSINRAAPYLASYSYDIEWKCIHLFTDPGVYITGGSEGDTDGYAVIILGWNGQGGHSC